MSQISDVLDMVNGDKLEDKHHKMLFRGIDERFSNIEETLKNCATKDDIKQLQEVAAKAAKFDLVVAVVKSKTTYFIAALFVAMAFGIRYFEQFFS